MGLYFQGLTKTAVISWIKVGIRILKPWPCIWLLRLGYKGPLTSWAGHFPSWFLLPPSENKSTVGMLERHQPP